MRHFNRSLISLTEPQREALRSPTNYIGASVQRTHATCDEWEKRIGRLDGQS